jgi:hypothetical protein
MKIGINWKDFKWSANSGAADAFLYYFFDFLGGRIAKNFAAASGLTNSL